MTGRFRMEAAFFIGESRKKRLPEGSRKRLL